VPFWGKFQTFWPLPCSEDLKIIVRHIFIRLALIFLPFSDNILRSGRHGRIQRSAVYCERRPHRCKGEHIRKFWKNSLFSIKPKEILVIATASILLSCPFDLRVLRGEFILCKHLFSFLIFYFTYIAL
jgi:hypothetical protein